MGKKIDTNAASPLITVIIATYNSATTLRWTLLSVQKQQFQNFEVRIIGDGCSDDSADVVASFNDPRFHWTNLSCNSGSQSAPNNEGLLQAKGSFIAYLGHDDLWFPWHLSSLLESLEKTKADFVFSLCACLGPKGICNPLGPPLIEEKNLMNHFTPPSSWLHRKNLIHLCGPWRTDIEKIQHPVDVDFWKKALQHKQRFHFCPCLTVLKFPSPWWKSYQLKENHPQEPFLEPLFNKPQELQIQVLTQIAVDSLPYDVRKTKPLWKKGLLFLMEFYGRNRFPLSLLLLSRFQKRRRKTWLERGLPLKPMSNGFTRNA